MPPGAGRGTILIVPILLLLAGVVILAGVVAVAMGRGGEMTEFATDCVPPTLDGVVTAADVAMLRPPSSLWGYNVPATDEALNRLAQALTERDVEIAVLRQQLAELRAAASSHPAIAATLLARSKAAAARGETSGLATAPRRVANPVAWEPGSDAGPAGRGPADLLIFGDRRSRVGRRRGGRCRLTGQQFGRQRVSRQRFARQRSGRCCFRGSGRHPR